MAPLNMTARWLEVRFTVSSIEEEEIVSALLIEMGVLGIWSESPFEREETLPVTIHGYFQEGRSAKEVQRRLFQALQASAPGVASLPFTLHPVAEEDWLAQWKKHYHSLEIGKNIRILPAWEEKKGDGKVEIQIDPGMGFGTGTHATTRLCLEAIENFFLQWQSPFPPKVLDLGCGSGILAIAAIKLGAGETAAVDNDPLALKNAEGNGNLNDCPLPLSEQIPPGSPYDLVVANILAETLIELKPLILPTIKEGGVLILSGILREKEAMVSKSYWGEGLTGGKINGDDRWVALTFEKRTPQNHSPQGLTGRRKQ